jgi:hypothetical protein
MAVDATKKSASPLDLQAWRRPRLHVYPTMRRSRIRASGAPPRLAIRKALEYDSPEYRITQLHPKHTGGCIRRRECAEFCGTQGENDGFHRHHL